MKINTPIIDFHAHGGSWKNRGFSDDPKLYLKQMNLTGVDKTCINSIFFGDAKHANNLVQNRFVSAYPDRFIGVAFVTPHYPEECIYELDRSFDQLNFKFLKIYPDYYGQPSDSEGYKPIMEWANHKGIAIMAHTRFPSDPPGTPTMSTSDFVFKRFEKFTTNYPNIKWVIAHAGSAFNKENLNWATSAAVELPNIWLETSSSGNGLYAVYDAVVNHGLGDRILFWSDVPILDYRSQISKIVTANISNEDKKKILGLNAIKLLNLKI